MQPPTVVEIFIDFLFSSTLSNWVYELDKWAPSVVKIAYKVREKIFTLFLPLFLPFFKNILIALWLLFTELCLFSCLFFVCPIKGHPCFAPWICASTPQREVQCLADHLWIHYQGQANTGQGERDKALSFFFYNLRCLSGSIAIWYTLYILDLCRVFNTTFQFMVTWLMPEFSPRKCQGLKVTYRDLNYNLN